jgi:hypothetical protein
VVCEYPNIAVNKSCIWITDECIEVQKSCEGISSEKVCNTVGAVVDEVTNQTKKCFYSMDGKCYGQEKECEHFSNEICLTHTELMCIPTPEGCRFSLINLCICLFEKSWKLLVI